LRPTQPSPFTRTIDIIEPDVLVSGSWDCSLRLWDPRAASPQQAVTTTPERVYAIDMTNHNIVVAMASRLFNIYDIRNMGTPAQQRESSLKYMTRSLACMSDGQGAYLLSRFSNILN
jgi:cell cycle arrest protein BUB3